MKTLTPLLAAAVFLLGGSITLAIEDNGLSGTALIVSGLIVLGAWLAIEAHNSLKNKDKDNSS